MAARRHASITYQPLPEIGDLMSDKVIDHTDIPDPIGLTPPPVPVVLPRPTQLHRNHDLSPHDLLNLSCDLLPQDLLNPSNNLSPHDLLNFNCDLLPDDPFNLNNDLLTHDFLNLNNDLLPHDPLKLNNSVSPHDLLSPSHSLSLRNPNRIQLPPRHQQHRLQLCKRVRRHTRQ
ncbi:hypothetical protein KI688_003660 [Linnemannia hyalina]|uniref:Uncharacterized protein n=1 Tax=Linnemannia hyalina TaxID=64524 RepID=A0A9P7XNB7_9FUNG|nr:hypothetical protein KI688_003660 [Linnemannia hyalina]